MGTSYKIEGKVIKIGETQEFASGFTKRELVVETEPGDYPQELPIEFFKEKGDILDGLKVGQDVAVECNLKGRAWEDRHFLSLVAWKMASGADAAPVEADEWKPTGPHTPVAEADGNLPF